MRFRVGYAGLRRTQRGGKAKRSGRRTSHIPRYREKEHDEREALAARHSVLEDLGDSRGDIGDGADPTERLGAPFEDAFDGFGTGSTVRGLGDRARVDFLQVDRIIKSSEDGRQLTLRFDRPIEEGGKEGRNRPG
jgi:hypothetical protein